MQELFEEYQGIILALICVFIATSIFFALFLGPDAITVDAVSSTLGGLGLA